MSSTQVSEHVDPHVDVDRVEWDSDKTTAITRASGQLSAAEREAGFITFAELQDQPKAPWLIDGIIRQRSLTFLYGRHDTYKTFLALDLCGALMTAESWLEAEVLKNGPVLYWAAEGSETLVERMSAWEIQHGTAVPAQGFQVLTEPPDLSDPLAMEPIVEAVASRDYAAVVIDTFGKSLGDADENSNSEVNQALLRATKLKELGAAVILIHHCGHSADRLRGASAMTAGIDTIIKAEVVGNLLVKVSCERQRRSREFEPFYAQLAEIEIGADERGRPETSLTVVGRASKTKGLAAEYAARREAVVDYLRKASDHMAKQSDIVSALELTMNGTARRSFFQDMAEDGLIEKAESTGNGLTWRLPDGI